jgi:hypothetical protein
MSTDKLKTSSESGEELNIGQQAGQEIDTFLQGRTFKVSRDLISSVGYVMIECQTMRNGSSQYIIDQILKGLKSSFVLIPDDNIARKKIRKSESKDIIGEAKGEEVFREVLQLMQTINENEPEQTEQTTEPNPSKLRAKRLPIQPEQTKIKGDVIKVISSVKDKRNGTDND